MRGHFILANNCGSFDGAIATSIGRVCLICRNASARARSYTSGPWELHSTHPPLKSEHPLGSEQSLCGFLHIVLGASPRQHA